MLAQKRSQYSADLGLPKHSEELGETFLLQPKISNHYFVRILSIWASLDDPFFSHFSDRG